MSSERTHLYAGYEGFMRDGFKIHRAAISKITKASVFLERKNSAAFGYRRQHPLNTACFTAEDALNVARDSAVRKVAAAKAELEKAQQRLEKIDCYDIGEVLS